MPVPAAPSRTSEPAALKLGAWSGRLARHSGSVAIAATAIWPPATPTGGAPGSLCLKSIAPTA